MMYIIIQMSVLLLHKLYSLAQAILLKVEKKDSFGISRNQNYRQGGIGHTLLPAVGLILHKLFGPHQEVKHRPLHYLEQSQIVAHSPIVMFLIWRLKKID